ncbi:MAG: hypothetical protein ACLQNE_07760 [Thermoguttaceae bacterium]
MEAAGEVDFQWNASDGHAYAAAPATMTVNIARVPLLDVRADRRGCATCLHACPKHPVLAPGLAGTHNLWRQAGKQCIVAGKHMNAGGHPPDVLWST